MNCCLTYYQYIMDQLYSTVTLFSGQVISTYDNQKQLFLSTSIVFAKDYFNNPTRDQSLPGTLLGRDGRREVYCRVTDTVRIGSTNTIRCKSGKSGSIRATDNKELENKVERLRDRLRNSTKLPTDPFSCVCAYIMCIQHVQRSRGTLCLPGVLQ